VCSIDFQATGWYIQPTLAQKCAGKTVSKCLLIKEVMEPFKFGFCLGFSVVILLKCAGEYQLSSSKFRQLFARSELDVLLVFEIAVHP
jgi:hypothetical protein